MDLQKPLKIPFLANPFNPKKIPPRKYASLSSLQTDRVTRELELGLEFGPPEMNLGGLSLKFEEGQWMAGSGGSATIREIQRLKKRNVQLEEENNLLKVKIEVLLDMLTETSIERDAERDLKERKTQHRK